ncbi:hypothetical protein T08_5621 [Trichinella sp. T8]|nr:hypothetical protein T08_5621 [Trichinella sp. T8]
MLILGVTRVSFTESFAIDASGLDRMNNSRSTCVIIKSGNMLFGWICQKSKNSRLNDGHLILDRRQDCSRTILAFILHQRPLIQHFRSDQELLIRSEMCEMNYANIQHLNMIIRCGHSRMCQAHLEISSRYASSYA